MDKTRIQKNAAILTSWIILFSLLFWIILWPLFFDPMRQYASNYVADRMVQFGPDAYFMDYSIHHGELPLWNPYILCGTPFQANPQSGLFYPPNFLRSLLNSPHSPTSTLISMGFLAWAHLLLFAISSLYFAKAHGLRTPTAFLCAVGLTTSSATTTSALNQVHFLYMVAWVPLILLLLRNAANAKSRPKQFRISIFAGLLYGVQVLEGTVQLLAYATIIYIVYFGAAVLTRGPWRITLPKELMKATLPLATFLITGLLLGAAILLPASQLSELTLRAKDIGQSPIRENIYDASTYGLMKMMYYFHPSASYEKFRVVSHPIARLIPLSFVFILCSTFAIYHPRRREAIPLLIAFLVLFDCGLGAPYSLGGLLPRIAPFRFSLSGYASIFISIPAVILAGYGIEAITLPAEKNRKTLIRILLHTIIVICLSIVFFRFSKTSAHANTVNTLATAGVAAAILIAYKNSRIASYTIVCCLLASTLATSLAVASVKTQSPLELPSATSHHFPLTANRRTVKILPNLNMYSRIRTINGYQPANLTRVMNILRNPGHDYRYVRAIQPNSVAQNPYTALFLKRPFWLVPQYIQGLMPNEKKLFPPTQYVYMSHDQRNPIPSVDPAQVQESSLSKKAKTVKIFGPNGDPLPPADSAVEDGNKIVKLRLGPINLPPVHSAIKLQYTCDSQGEFSIRVYEMDRKFFIEYGPFKIDSAESIPISFEWPLPDVERFTLTIQAKLDMPQGTFQVTNLSVVADPTDEDYRIKILSYTANRVDLALIDLPAYRILAFIDADYPGWQAYIDNEPVPILRANDAFKAVLVPPGTHQVTFIFRPKIVYLGAGISIISLVAILLFLFLSRAKSPIK